MIPNNYGVIPDDYWPLYLEFMKIFEVHPSPLVRVIINDYPEHSCKHNSGLNWLWGLYSKNYFLALEEEARQRFWWAGIQHARHMTRKHFSDDAMLEITNGQVEVLEQAREMAWKS